MSDSICQTIDNKFEKTNVDPSLFLSVYLLICVFEFHIFIFHTPQKKDTVV